MDIHGNSEDDVGEVKLIGGEKELMETSSGILMPISREEEEEEELVVIPAVQAETVEIVGNESEPEGMLVGRRASLAPVSSPCQLSMQLPAIAPLDAAVEDEPTILKGGAFMGNKSSGNNSESMGNQPMTDITSIVILTGPVQQQPTAKATEADVLNRFRKIAPRVETANSPSTMARQESGNSHVVGGKAIWLQGAAAKRGHSAVGGAATPDECLATKYTVESTDCADQGDVGINVEQVSTVHIGEAIAHGTLPQRSARSSSPQCSLLDAQLQEQQLKRTKKPPAIQTTIKR